MIIRYFILIMMVVSLEVCLGAITPDTIKCHPDPADRHSFHDIKLAAPMLSGSRARFGVCLQSFTGSITFKNWHLGTFTRSLALRLTGGSQDEADDYYHILGVDKNCNEDEIKKAYRYSNAMYGGGAWSLCNFSGLLLQEASVEVASRQKSE
jgi:hypothetical protein